jgi:carboxylesterase
MSKLARPSKKGFTLAGSGAQVLLLHGYTGSPYDLRPVANFLHEHGFHVVVPLLKGHGTKPSDIHGVLAEDWLLQAEHVIKSFDPTRPIVVGGLSMGALIAMLMVKNHRDIQALLLFSPALHLGILAELTIVSAQIGVLEKHRSLTKLSGGSDINDPQAKARTPSYKEMPVDGLLQFDALRKLAKINLEHINCPTFMAFGALDSAIDAKDSHGMMMAAITAPVFSRFYKNSKHVVTLDYDREQLVKDVWYFLNHYVGIKP